MYTLLTADGLYDLSFSDCRISSICLSSSFSNSLIVSPSIPPLPRLALTFFHASFSIFVFSSCPYTLNNLSFNGSFIAFTSHLPHRFACCFYVSITFGFSSSATTTYGIRDSSIPSVRCVSTVSSVLRIHLTSACAPATSNTLIDRLPLKQADLTGSSAPPFVDMLCAFTPYGHTLRHSLWIVCIGFLTFSAGSSPYSATVP